ncbi:hypothetical protein LP316_11750 [Thalassotalea sp. LPB0316]|uniref:hypothetical protein n=1 Tax=Thalassotalea sp. LPB0316 TaxID=2769490 RepID=UPI00186955F5|nr:hypothetical protein [Thalassotalea sp. LPB0316]QOL24976.1 hypothetical protein LP316_11750 [Thalassotalea sp. LPB0316]
MFVQSGSKVALVILAFALLAVISGRIKVKIPESVWLEKVEKAATWAMYGSYLSWLAKIIIQP